MNAGLTLVGAVWSSSSLVMNDGSNVRLGPSQISWVKKEDEVRGRGRRVDIPCWLDATRADSLFNVNLPLSNDVEASAVAQRAVALLAAD